MTPDEDLLIKEIRLGNKEAFTLLYNRYYEALFITAARVLRDSEEASDIIQDIFLSIWNRREEIVITSSLSAYLHTSVRYKCIHFIEKNITRKDYLIQLTNIDSSDYSQNPALKLQLKEMQEKVSNIIEKMPPKMQKVYKLSRNNQLSYREISIQMGISHEATKKQLHRALVFIRSRLSIDLLWLSFLIETINFK